MNQRIPIALALLLAAFWGANGLFMILDPLAWYHAVPGVSETGPPNSHFILDVGCAYLASMVLLIAAIRIPESRGVLTLAGAVWPAMHASVHVVGHFAEHAAAISAAEAFGIYVPVAVQLSLGIHWLGKPHGSAALQAG
jgi:hypothetical protein